MPRNSRVIEIEQSLGLASERGISRRGYKDSPPMQELLWEIKEISKKYVNSAPAEIRDSRALRGDAEDLFARIGEKLWPAADVPRPSWLADPAKDNLGGRYDRELRFSNATDRPVLRKHFTLLIIEKTCILHDNEQAKVRKLRQEHLDSNPGVEDEVASDGGPAVQGSPAPPTGSHATRSSLATPSAVTKPEPADEPRRGFQAVNHPPTSRNVGSHGGITKETGASTAKTTASSTTTPLADTKAAPKHGARTAHGTPIKSTNTRVTRKRANTTEQVVPSKKSCVTTNDGLDSFEDSLPVRSAMHETPGISHSPQATSVQKAVQSPERNRNRPKRETTRSVARTKDPEKRSKTAKPLQSPPGLSLGRARELTRAILGDLADCGSVNELIRVSPDIKYNRHMLETIKDTLDQNPDSKDNLSYFHDALQQMTGHQREQEATSDPTPAPDAPLSRAVPSRLSVEGIMRPLALVEMNWGGNVDFIDGFELPPLTTVHEFFHLVEAHMPQKLKDSGRRLKEITVTPMTDVIDRKVNFRIPSDDERGRGSLRLMMNRLKQYAVGAGDGTEMELMFTAVWEE